MHSSNPRGSNYELTNHIARNCPLTDQSRSGVSQPVRGIIATENTLPHSPILIPDELTTSGMPQHNEIIPRLNGKTKAFWLCPNTLGVTDLGICVVIIMSLWQNITHFSCNIVLLKYKPLVNFILFEYWLNSLENCNFYIKHIEKNVHTSHI